MSGLLYNLIAARFAVRSGRSKDLEPRELWFVQHKVHASKPSQPFRAEAAAGID